MLRLSTRLLLAGGLGGILGVGAAMPGCGGDSGGAGGGASTSVSSTTTESVPVTPEKACQDVAKSRCAELDACSNGFAIPTRYGSIEECQSRNEQVCRLALAATDTGETADAMEACANAIAVESCEQVFDNYEPSACTPPPGKRAKGAACGTNGQCKSTYCAIGENAACGTCEDPPASGAKCQNNSDCSSPEGCLLAKHVCVTAAAMGDACGGQAPCEAGLTCVGASKTAMGTCQFAVSKSGDPCDPSRKTGPDCDGTRGLYCNGMSKTCEAIAIAAAGDACGKTMSGVVTCGSGLACKKGKKKKGKKRMGTCVPLAADGATCGPVNGESCNVPSKCVFDGDAGDSDAGVSGTCEIPDPSQCM